MKKFLIACVLFLTLMGFSIVLAPRAEAARVRGYWNSWGSWTDSYYRSRPNSLRYDNYNYRSYQPLYNNSYYYPTRNYSPRWYTPSWSDSDYYSGYSSGNLWGW